MRAERPVGEISAEGDANAAIARLLTINKPDRFSLAAAYALGYMSLAMGLYSDEDGESEWVQYTDPLDVLFLGAAFHKTVRDGYELGNARTAWLRLLRETPHWSDIKRFVSVAVQVSEELSLPIGDAEVLLLLTTRLEAAGLDRRKLSSTLRPENLLANRRVLTGPSADFIPPTPSPEATRAAAALMDGLEVESKHFGTCLDALCLGLSLLERARFPVRSESSMFLVALYAGLLASDDEDLDELGERAEAWALGLRDESPLTPIVDIMLLAAFRQDDPVATMSHLLMIPAFTCAAEREDCTWHSAPGTDFVEIALESGHPQVVSRAGRVVSGSPALALAVKGYLHRYEEHLGRPLAPDDYLFPDLDADEPVSISVEELARVQTAMLETVGVHAAWIYACNQNDGLLPMPHGGFASDRDSRDWQEAIDEYVRQHPDDIPDHDQEMERLRAMQAMQFLTIAAGDRDLAQWLISELDKVEDDAGIEVELMVDLLEGIQEGLLGELHESPELFSRALEIAETVSGAELARRVEQCAELSAGDVSVDLAAQFVVAMARLGA